MNGRTAKALRRLSSTLEQRSLGPKAEYPGGPVRHPAGTRRAIYKDMKKMWNRGEK